MRRAIAGLAVAVATLSGVWAAFAGTSDTPSPVPADIAARLPRYCRFTLDLSGEAHPHAALFAKTRDGDATCPFAPDHASAVTVIAFKGGGACDASRFPGLKVSAVEDLDGRTARSLRRCASDVWKNRPAQAASSRARGRAWLLRFDDTQQSLRDVAAFENQGFADRLGDPFAVVAFANRYDRGHLIHPGVAYKCVEMLPGVDIDALTFLREAGPPLPDGVTEQEVTGRDCGELVNERAGKHAATSGAAMPPESVESNPAFSIWLQATKATPKGLALAARLRYVLLRDGLKTAKTGGDDLFVPNREVVARTPDGGYLGFSVGSDIATAELRALTPDTCVALFDMAAEARLHITTMQTDALDLAPHGVTADTPRTEVADAADLCALLRPGFDEWQDATPRLPIDLNDVDGRETSFTSFTIEPES